MTFGNQETKQLMKTEKPNEAKSTELYTVNKIDIKGLYVKCVHLARFAVSCRIRFGKSAYWASLFDLSKIINAVIIHL